MKNYRELVNRLEAIQRTTVEEAVDPARLAAYQRAIEQMARLEAAAKTSSTDPIVRSRMGLPPPLPPIEQWNGSMTAPSGKPDLFARALGTGDIEGDMARAAGTNTTQEATIQVLFEKLKKLDSLIAQYLKLKVAISNPTVKESTSYTGNIAKRLIESFGQPLSEFDAMPTTGNLTGLGRAGLSASGKMIGRALPFVGAALSAQDTIDRWKKGDYIGAGLSGLGGLASFVPVIGTAASLGLAAANIGRDYARDNNKSATDIVPSTQSGKPKSKLAQLQSMIGAVPDGIYGPETKAKLAAWQQKKGIAVDGIPGPDTYEVAGLTNSTPARTIAEEVAALRDKLAIIENSQAGVPHGSPSSEVNPFIRSTDGQADESALDIVTAGIKGVSALGKAFMTGVKNPAGPLTGAAMKAGGVIGRNPGKTAATVAAIGGAGGVASGNKEQDARPVPSTNAPTIKEPVNKPSRSLSKSAEVNPSISTEPPAVEPTPSASPELIALRHQIDSLVDDLSNSTDTDVQNSVAQIKSRLDTLDQTAIPK